MSEIYDMLRRPPRWALREIKDGDLKGKTDINPQWRYEAMTQVFGLVGIGWKYEIQKLWTEHGGKDEVLAFAQVAVYVRDPETKEWSDAIIGIGGSKLVNNFNKAGIKNNDEGYKMAVTDAFSTALKMLGVAADVYAGKWDGSKYRDTVGAVPEKAPSQQVAPAPAPVQKEAPKPQKKAPADITEYLLQKGFDPKECAKAGSMWEEAKEVLADIDLNERKSVFREISTNEELIDWNRGLFWKLDAAHKIQDAQIEGNNEPEEFVDDSPTLYEER